MATNEEIMDMLKVILEKVERLESIKTDSVTINSGTITIQAEDNPIEIHEADDVLIQTGQSSPVGIEQAGDVTVNAPVAGTVTIECDGNIEGDVGVGTGPSSTATISIVCNGDIHGDIDGSDLEKEE